MKFPRDFPIFWPLMVIMLLCIQYFAGSIWLLAFPWASSHSWWGKSRSIPPPWRSNCLPRYLELIAVHSTCQPGNPRPQGEFHFIKCSGEAFFHKAKSIGFFFSVCPSSSLLPLINSTTTLPESLPYLFFPSYLRTSK